VNGAARDDGAVAFGYVIPPETGCPDTTETVTAAGVVDAAAPAPALVTGVVTPDHSSMWRDCQTDAEAVIVIDVTDAAAMQVQISTLVFCPDRNADTWSVHVFDAESVIDDTDWVAPVRRWHLATSVFPAVVVVSAGVVPVEMTVEAAVASTPRATCWTRTAAISRQWRRC
jgi:hypothetical protein